MKYNPKKFTIKYQAIFNSLDTNDIKMWVAKPSNLYYQKIEKVLISPKPKNSYKDLKRNKILYFEFKNQKNINLQMDIKATLWRNKINLIKEKILAPSISSKLFEQYIKNEEFLEQTPAVKKMTYQITENDQFILDKIYSITKFLEKNFIYTYPVKKRGVKNLNLNSLCGDCGEVGALFVTMCRILGIPAINKTGYVIYYNELNNIYEHGWTSIYLKPYGWIDIDPLANNIEIENGKYIYKNNNYFLSFTEGYNLKIKPKIPNNFIFKYWKELGLPMTNKSVQILQPLIFASKNKVKFSDNIKLLP